MSTIYIIMHRLMDCNDVVEPDKLVLISDSKFDTVYELAGLQTGACEHDYYYVVIGEV